MRRARVLLALSAVLVVAAPAAPASARRAPAVVFGTGGWSFPKPQTLADLHGAGLRTWRVTMSWADVSPSGPAMEFSGYDQLMRAAAANHVEMLVTLTGCPRWACPAGGPPKSNPALGQFQRFVKAAVLRYGSHGSVWQGRKVRYVRYWQVFNEVNGADQWAPRPSPREYGKVLRATSKTIRRSDRRAKVVMAGLGEKMTIFLKRFLPRLYRRPGVRRAFDVMAPEGYTTRASGVVKIMRKTRHIMRRFHDAKKPIFVTEMSWATGGPPFPFVVTPAQQAAKLQASWRQLRACGARFRIRRVYWFAYDDRAAKGEKDYWGFHNGLTDLSGNPKPAMTNFRSFLTPRRKGIGRCRVRR